MRVAEFPIEAGREGSSIVAEVDAPTGGGMLPAGRAEDRVEESKASLERALSTLGAAAIAWRGVGGRAGVRWGEHSRTHIEMDGTRHQRNGDVL